MLGPQGFAIHSNVALPPDTKLVSCPFSLAITPEVAVKALRLLGIISTDQEPSWTEKQLICSYICLHWILGDSRYVYGVVSKARSRRVLSDQMSCCTLRTSPLSHHQPRF